MITWHVHRCRGKPSRIETYTNSGPSGVGGGVQVIFGPDYPGETADSGQGKDALRIVVCVIADVGDSCPHERPRQRPEQKLSGLRSPVIGALDEESIGEDHAEEAPSGDGKRSGSPLRAFLEECRAGE